MKTVTTPREESMKPMQSKYLDLSDVKIAYSEFGEGENLILLHPNSMSKKLFLEYQIEYFKNFHTYALDSRGHGETQSADDIISIEQNSHDVIQFCNAMNITEAMVIGYSDGGNIALYLAVRYPEVFKKVVLVSPNYLASSTKKYMLKAIQMLYNVMVLFQKIGLNTQKEISRIDLMLHDIGLSEAEIRTITTMVLIIFAQHDMFIESSFYDLGNLIKKCEIKKIAKCNHLTVYKKSAAITTMKEFLLH
jgi:pimeloyl-ACP methyl ester carboxylesterase